MTIAELETLIQNVPAEHRNAEVLICVGEDQDGNLPYISTNLDTSGFFEIELDGEKMKFFSVESTSQEDFS